jgi:hypothetical protein
LTAVTAPFAKSNFACVAETTSSIGSTTEDIFNDSFTTNDSTAYDIHSLSEDNYSLYESMQ